MMMRIAQVKLTRLQMPLKSAFETSFGRETTKDFLLVTVEGDGYEGYAESVAMTAPVYNEETTDTVQYMLETFLIPQLFQAVKNEQLQHPDDVSHLFKPFRRNQMAKAVLEGAVWDLYCKQQSMSLAKALGGEKAFIDVGVSIGIEPTVAEVLDKVDAFLAEGYKKIKVKIKPGFDVQLVEAIRKQFGDRVPLMADANSAYTLADIDRLKALDQYDLMMIEQPLAHDDIIDHAQLQKQLITPICLDESIHSVEDARKAIDLGSCRIINIKIGRVGGLTEAKKIHDLCQQNNIPVWCGGMLEAGIGRAHNIALTSLANFTIPGDTSASSRYWAQDIVTPEVVLAKPGMLAVPDTPGIGYDLNLEAVESFKVDEKTVRREDL